MSSWGATQHQTQKYKEKGWLYEQYWGEETPTIDIAAQFSVGAQTIRYWLEKHGIPRRDSGGMSVDSYIFSMRPREWLFKQYWVDLKSSSKMAKENGVTDCTVTAVLKRQDPPIKRKPSGFPYASGYDNPSAKTHATRHFDEGYVDYYVGLSQSDASDRFVREHRITAIGEWGLEAVKGKHVHHANGIKWLNVPEFDMDIPELEQQNLVPMDPITHSKSH